MRANKALDQIELRAVRVLIFVDVNVVETPLMFLEHIGMFLDRVLAPRVAEPKLEAPAGPPAVAAAGKEQERALPPCAPPRKARLPVAGQRGPKGMA